MSDDTKIMYRRNSKAVLRRRAARVACYVLLCCISVIYLYPFLWSISASLKPLDEIYAYPPTIKISDPQWGNYPRALRKLPFGLFFVNTLLICIPAVVGTVITSALVGYAFARLRWKGRDICFILMISTMLMPGQILMIPRYLINQALGWMGTYKPLIVPAWLGMNAFGIFLFRQCFKSMPGELGESARIDGAGAWQTFWHIYLPLARPVTATLGVLAMIGSWQDFMGPLIYLSDYHKFPLSLGLMMYKSVEGSWVNLISAASLVTLLPLLIIFIVFQKYIVKSMVLTVSKQ